MGRLPCGGFKALFSTLAVRARRCGGVLVDGAGNAEANWLSALTKGAGKAARHADTELGAVGRAASHLHELPAGAKGALAAHATPEGHWQFVNKEGQVFTAGTADELKRAVPTLVPEGLPGEGKLSLYLSEDSVFANRAHLDKLPKDAELHLVTDHGAFPLARGNGGALKLVYRPNVALEIADQAADARGARHAVAQAQQVRYPHARDRAGSGQGVVLRPAARSRDQGAAGRCDRSGCSSRNRSERSAARRRSSSGASTRARSSFNRRKAGKSPAISPR